MFLVKTVRRGLWADTAFLVAIEDRVVTKRWLGWDRLGSLTLKSEALSVERGATFSLKVRKGSLNDCQSLSIDEVDLIYLKRYTQRIRR